MFTGIVEGCAPVRSFERARSGARLVVEAPAVEGWGVRRGESVAVSGCCLTVADVLDARGRPLADVAGGAMAFDLSAETLQRTWLGALAPGSRVNLERALRLSDRIGGHLVSGHVDGTGSIVAIEDSADGGRIFRFEVGAELEPYLVEKGSIAVDGISLTVVAPRGRAFDVAVVPHTLAVTSLGDARAGRRVNLEADLIGKWVERLVRSRGTPC